MPSPLLMKLRVKPDLKLVVQLNPILLDNRTGKLNGNLNKFIYDLNKIIHLVNESGKQGMINESDKEKKIIFFFFENSFNSVLNSVQVFNNTSLNFINKKIFEDIKDKLIELDGNF